jgi:hypothetical protein
MTRANDSDYNYLPIVTPAGGVDWANDVKPTHTWKSLDTTATVVGGFTPWDGDINDDYPPTDSMVYRLWIGYQTGSLDSTKYPEMSFLEWKHTYLKLNSGYHLVDTPACESMARFGYDADFVFDFPLTDDEVRNHVAPSDIVPSVSMTDVTTPPVEGAVLFASESHDDTDGWVRRRAYSDEYLVSYSLYGGTGGYSNPTGYHWSVPSDWVLK